MKADVTFLSIHMDTWNKSWQKFQVDDKQQTTLMQVKEKKGKSM
jgi:hypothetical protein